MRVTQVFAPKIAGVFPIQDDMVFLFRCPSISRSQLDDFAETTFFDVDGRNLANQLIWRIFHFIYSSFLDKVSYIHPESLTVRP